MKAIHLLIATLIMMSLASCTAESSDPVDNSSSTYFLERTYGARSVTYEENNSDNLNLNNLPAISLKEADEILSNLRKHTNAKEEHNILAADKGNQTLLKVITSQTINGKYTFTIQLNLTGYADGDLYYNGYNAECSSSLMKWYVKGFSLASDNSEGNFIFQSESYIYMKVADNGIKYMQIPVSIWGTYNPKSHDASFTYKL